VLVRDGVEDFHAAGAFDDEQAPTFNRLVREAMGEYGLLDGGAAVEEFFRRRPKIISRVEQRDCEARGVRSPPNP